MDAHDFRRLGAVLLTLALAGCASQAARNDPAEPRAEDRKAARELYDGEPAVMHGTEFPVTTAAEGIARGDEAWRKGDLDLAIYMYVQSLAFDTTNPEPLQKIGAIHEKRGNRALAERAFEMALRLDPDNAATNERLGLLYLQSQRHEAAETLFAHAVAKDPKRWQSHNGLGITADRRGDFAAAIAHYDTANAIEPRAATVVNNRGYSRYLAGDLPGAEADLRLAISLGAPAGVWTNLARVQAAQMHYEEALESMLREHDEATAYNQLGEAALEAGDLVKARDYFSEAIRAAPRYYEAAQENLAQVNERIDAAGQHPTRVTTADAKVYAKGVYVGQVERGREVAVLFTQGPYALVRYQDSDGSDKTGWVTSSVLAEQRALP